MPKVTICVPAYNAEYTIVDTLASLRAQTFGDVEVIVSDNHSTDDTVAVVSRCADERLRLVVCPVETVKTRSPLANCLSAIQNWNSLRDLGEGEYVGIYHADDVFEPELVARQVDLLERHPECSAVFSTHKTIDEAGRLLEDSSSSSSEQEQSEERFSQVDVVRRMIRVGQSFSSSGVLVRRSSWQQAGVLDAQKFEQAADTEFWIRLAGIGPIAVLKPAMVRRREHRGQDSRNGLTLYRDKALPLIAVLSHWASQASVCAQLDPEDCLHFGATCADEYLRIGINLCRDERRTEAEDVLRRLPPCDASMVKFLMRSRRRVSLLRLLAGKALIFAQHFGLGKRVASAIASTRIGFPEWD